jgi:hypothetical protein
MTIDQRQLYAPADSARDYPSVFRRVLREMAVQDWLVFGYFVALNVAVLSTLPGATLSDPLAKLIGLWVFQVSSLIIVRGGLIKHTIVAPLLYRCAIYGTVQFSYFLFKDLLPMINPSSLDRELYHLDLALFGFEPAMAMDAWVNSTTTEWFAFFYFGYFFLLALHVIPMLLFGKREPMLSEFCFGMLVVFCIGHIIYTLVPGYGPYRAMADHFSNPLPEGVWRDLVLATVASGGAQKDIFPSLHTAAPTFIMLWSFRHRKVTPFRYTWPVVAFTALNIVIATMFLRWHYVIDVLAGLLLASAAVTSAAAVTRWELARRAELGLSANWPPFSLSSLLPSHHGSKRAREQAST